MNAKQIVICCVLSTISCSYKPILSLNFDGEELNSFERRLISHENIELSDNNGKNDSKAIMVKYEGYERGSRRVMRLLKLTESTEEATLNYSVKFSKSFNFVIGGKLHGFIPENKIVGGKNIKADGWSARANFKENGHVASYIYHQNKPTQWGDGITSKEPVFTPGTYNDVSIYMKLNKPETSKNGKFEIWVDGRLIIKHDSIQYRKQLGEQTLISFFYFSTFHGGSTAKYAPKNKMGEFASEYAWFDNISVYSGKRIVFEN